MCFGTKLFQQFRLRPSELPRRTDVPHPFFQALTALQNGCILRPSDGHGLRHGLRSILISSVKIPHPTEISGGETGGGGICLAKVFGSGDSGAFLGPGADELANLEVQFHLWQFRRYQLVQRHEHGAIVNRFSDVHRFLLSGAKRYYFRRLKQSKEKCGNI